MSSARKRRAEIQANPPAPNKIIPSSTSVSARNAPSPTASNGLTLQQIINITDRRLTALENSFQKNGGGGGGGAAIAGGASTALDKETIDEIYSRFDILLSEVAELKDTVMKLQTYTMDVNRVLFDERKKSAVVTECDNKLVEEEAEEEGEEEEEKEDKEENNSEAVEDIVVVAETTNTTKGSKRGSGGGSSAARRVRGGGITVNI